MADLTVTALSDAAQRLANDAKAHKRAEAEHRRRARAARRKLDAIRAFCDQHGIELIIDTHTEPEDVHSGRPDSHS